jgi:O-succinylbenzoate synthase
MPNFVLAGDVSASDRYYHRDITNERFVLNADSTIDVPTGHGLGVTIDEEALQSYTLAKVVV